MNQANTIPKTPPTRYMGLVLAALVSSLWVGIHLYSIFFHTLSAPLWQTLSLIALHCWLYVGLFIIAHDTIHGSLWPGKPKANEMIGTIIMFVYAGFDWKIMSKAHHDHHDFSGTEGDPDFNANDPVHFWSWYFKFFFQYFGVKQIVILVGFTGLYILLGASYINTIVMWAVPAILSSIQLFYFGTYLTHRHKGAFPDTHNARSNNYPLLISLLTCFHFGYHHEHHLYPHEPWWRLPARKGDIPKQGEAT